MKSGCPGCLLSAARSARVLWWVFMRVALAEPRPASGLVRPLGWGRAGRGPGRGWDFALGRVETLRGLVVNRGISGVVLVVELYHGWVYCGERGEMGLGRCLSGSVMSRLGGDGVLKTNEWLGRYFSPGLQARCYGM